MPPKRVLSPESVWDTAAVLQAFADAGVKPVHAVKLWGHLIRHPDARFEDVPDLPKAAISLLNENFSKSTSIVTQCKRSEDGETIKLLVTLQGGMQVEAVIMTYDTTGAIWDALSAQQHIMGVSDVSMPGMSGTMGLKGNLTSGEIIEQLVHARRETSIRNIVFMGMGEPLNNYDAVRSAVQMMTDPRYFGLRKERVTISTVGVIPRIKQLPEDLPGVSLALSLHAPTQELRHRIVPSARAYKLDRLMEAVKEFEERSKLRLFVEYVMLAGVNDQLEQAHDLGKLLQGHNALLNLIPWNPVYSPDGPKFAAPSQSSVSEFQQTIKSLYGINCTVRQEKGQDISGACGQLVIEVQDAVAKSCSAEVASAVAAKAKAVGDIEELAGR